MKRYNIHWGKMYPEENGAWVSFEEHDDSTQGAVAMNGSITKEIDRIKSSFANLVIATDNQIGNLEQQVLNKNDEIAKMYVDRLSQSDVIYKLQSKIINMTAIIWFGLVPTIIGLTAAMFLIGK